MPDSNLTHNVLCFGEVLWDCLPDGEYPGGAPMNVAYHLTKLGCTAWLFSSVGDDPRGAALLRVLQDWRVRCDHVTVDSEKPTGTVDVTLVNGSPSYEIVEDVAWDRIAVPDQLAAARVDADAVVYGSLAMRGEQNRESLARLLAEVPSALKVFDVNLRPPFDDHEVIWQLARKANLIKLNDEEVEVLLGGGFASGDLVEGAREVARRARCDRVCVTAGADGAGLLDHGRWHWVAGEEVAVGDTVGAGDAFLAALVAGLLQMPEIPEKILERASRLAGFVASKKGATPDYNVTP
ncbi:MAG: carbohydrate kinase [Pseudomonadota bacterium]